MDSLHLPPSLIVTLGLGLDGVANGGAPAGSSGSDPHDRWRAGRKLATAGVKKGGEVRFSAQDLRGRGKIRSEVHKGLMSSSTDTTWITNEVIDGYTEEPRETSAQC
jgi:hypothetical protein